jgi:phosphopantothenoylcysteine decarboxylase/phosphopantothenate--cysteine ligase
MHRSMFENPIFQKNLNALAEIPKVKVLPSRMLEGKAKVLGVDEIVAWACHEISNSKMKQKSVVISLGPTRSFLDDMRYLSNRSGPQKRRAFDITTG